MSSCNTCMKLMRENSKLIDALLRCNHFAVAAKNRLSNGGSAEDAAESLDAIAEYSKDGIERINK